MPNIEQYLLLTDLILLHFPFSIKLQLLCYTTPEWLMSRLYKAKRKEFAWIWKCLPTNAHWSKNMVKTGLVSSLNCIDMDGFAKLEGKLRFSFYPITKCWIMSSVGLFYAMNVVWYALHCCLLHIEWVSMWRILFQMNLAFCERWTLCNILTFQ